MQSMSNADEYKLSEQGEINADVVDNGGGVSTQDALGIQMVVADILDKADFPITSDKL